MDPWIPGRYELRLRDHPIIESQENTRVDEWIDHDSRKWKENVVRETMSSEEAQIVINVLIPTELREDEFK